MSDGEILAILRNAEASIKHLKSLAHKKLCSDCPACTLVQWTLETIESVIPTLKSPTPPVEHEKEDVK